MRSKFKCGASTFTSCSVQRHLAVAGKVLSQYTVVGCCTSTSEHNVSIVDSQNYNQIAKLSRCVVENISQTDTHMYRLLLTLLSITLLNIAVEQVFTQGITKEHQGLQAYGGHLKSPVVGTITTPNFPNPFPVPVKCKWIIEHDIVNGTISIYFTQQYTTSRLTFTEYMYYDESYKLGERRALTLTDENITRIKWLKAV
ncbi:hypothetical protein HW555_014004 [Spodoptera exigua]|uniref:CUB domain-containing protein n=1 Tax=Spodoptera exigua TaxID=7107 RepID=A0A835KY35_SPOEX|nr:hypothetical protein HW555_014004 [Spodoptera exigua]